MEFLLCTLTPEVQCWTFHRNHVIWRTKITTFWRNGNDSKQPYCRKTKHKRTNNDLQNTMQKTNTRATRAKRPLETDRNVFSGIVHWEIYSPCSGAAEMLLHMSGKFTIVNIEIISFRTDLHWNLWKYPFDKTFDARKYF